MRLLRTAFFREFPAILMDYSPRLPHPGEDGDGTHLHGSADVIACSILAVIEQARLEREFIRSPTAAEFIEIIADQYASPGAML